MKGWKNMIVPILFSLGGVGWLVKTLKQIVDEENDDRDTCGPAQPTIRKRSATGRMTVGNEQAI